MKWIKIIILCCIIFIISCRKVEVIPTPQLTTTDIFSKSEVTVKDGQDIQFSLKVNGKYILTLLDSTTNQVVSKERFNGVVGDNIKKIYTKSFTQKTLNLYLSDENNNQISKTRIIIN